MFKRSEYVPRHALFEPLEIKSPVLTREITENVPILDENGELIQTSIRRKIVPITETIGKYKEEDFKIQNLISAGVPLKEVSIVESTEKMSDYVDYVSGKLDILDTFIQKQPQVSEQIVETLKTINNE